MLTQKGIERFNESRFKSRKVKGIATSSENRKFFVAVMEGTLGVVKKMLTNSGFVKLLWAYVVFARAEKKAKNNIRPQQFHESAIGQHLLDNAQCALHYSNEKFSILARGRYSFHLSALEATFIKSLNPFLCKQKEFVYSLKIS